jgi:dolichyl-phosphate beta-glucosyltransferase
MDQIPFLSIIIPALNEEQRLTASLERLISFVKARDFVTELIVVDNASSDRTKQIIMEFCSRYPFINYLYEPTRGKGAAVKAGIMAGRGDYMLICDADLAVPIDEVAAFLPPRLQDNYITIGSREVKGARRYNEPFYRHLMGRVFNLIIRMLIIPSLKDTQCGFKCFPREIAHELFSLCTINGWSFDVEILYIANLKGHRIVEAPVNWYYRGKSKIKPAQDTWHMLKEILQIQRNGKRGVYATGHQKP